MAQTIHKFRRTMLLVLCGVVLALGALFAAACGSSSVTLTFVTNGGTEIAPITAEAGETITPPANPEKDGYVFGGWYTNAEFSGSAVRIPSVMPETSTTYYAQFTEAPRAELTLVAGAGGTLATATHSLMVGANVSSYLANIAPTPVNSSVTFGGWFNGNSPLSTTLAMPASGLRLTARYRVSYTVEVFLQQSDGQYKSDSSVSIAGGEGWVDDTLILGNDVLVAPEGYHISPTGNRGLTLGIENNVYQVYFDVDTFSVVYANNAPEGTVATGNVQGQTGVYKGATVQASENGWTIEGYRFAGWATSRDGAVVYAAGDDIVVNENLLLYACWNFGMLDGNGGADNIYILKENAGKVLLVRSGLDEKLGTYTAETREFVFTTDGGTALRGRVSEDGKTFVYYREELAATYSLYDWTLETPAVSATQKMELDGFDGAKYTNPEGAVVTGKYTRSENGFIFASETDTFYFELGTFAANGTQFRIRDELFGRYPHFSREESMVENTVTLSFDGFGSVVYAQSGEETLCSYSALDDGAIQVSGESVNFLCGLVSVRYGSGQNVTAFTEPDASRGTHKLSDTVSLRCNGFDYAVYIDGTTETEGYYQFEEFYFTDTTDWGLISAQFLFGGTVTSVPVLIDLNGTQAPERLGASAGTVTGTDASLGAATAIRLFGERSSGTAFFCVADDYGNYITVIRGTYENVLDTSGEETFRYHFEAQNYASEEIRDLLASTYNDFVFGIFQGSSGNQMVYVIRDRAEGTTFSFTIGEGAAAQQVKLTVDGFSTAVYVDGAGTSHETIYQYLSWYPVPLTDYGYLQFLTEYSQSGELYTIRFALSALDAEGDIPATVVSNDIGFYGELNNRLSDNYATIYLLPDNAAYVYVELESGETITIAGRATQDETSGQFTFAATAGAQVDSRASAYANFSFVLLQLDSGIVFSAYVAAEEIKIGDTLTLSGYGTASYNNTQYYYEFDESYVHLIPLSGSAQIVLLLSDDKTSFRESDATRGIYFHLNGDQDVDYDSNIMVLDGFGNATFYAQSGEDLTTLGEATYVVTANGTAIVTFKGTAPQGFASEFEFASYVISDGAGGSVSVYLIADKTLEKEYVINGGGRITVDAFNQVTYYDEDDFVFDAIFVINDDDVIEGRKIMYVGVYNSMGTAISNYFTFAIADDGVHLVLLDDVLGVYTLLGGKATLTFDGLGNATYVNGDTTIKGTYVWNETSGEFIAEGNNGFSFNLLTVLAEDGTRVYVYVPYDADWDQTFVTGDWAVVMLDGYVGATYIDEFGVSYEAYFEVVNETTIVLYGGDLDTEITITFGEEEAAA